VQQLLGTGRHSKRHSLSVYVDEFDLLRFLGAAPKGSFRNEPASAAIVLRRKSTRPFSTSSTVLFAMPLWTDRYVWLQPRDSRSCLIRLPNLTCKEVVGRLGIVPILRYSKFPRYRYSGTATADNERTAIPEE
jgi:hypothetical protein